MILVDTNIIIDFWDKPTIEVEKIFAENPVAVCGVIKTELLRGSNSDYEFSKMEKALDDFAYLNFAENDWLNLAKQFIVLNKERSCCSVSRRCHCISCYKKPL